jgi:hypothetical protein
MVASMGKPVLILVLVLILVTLYSVFPNTHAYGESLFSVPIIPPQTVVSYPVIVHVSGLLHNASKSFDALTIFSFLKPLEDTRDYINASSNANLTQNGLTLTTLFAYGEKALSFSGVAVGVSSFGMVSRYSSLYIPLPHSLVSGKRLLVYVKRGDVICEADLCLIIIGFNVACTRGNGVENYSVAVAIHVSGYRSIEDAFNLSAYAKTSLAIIGSEGFEEKEFDVYIARSLYNLGTNAIFLLVPSGKELLYNELFIDAESIANALSGECGGGIAVNGVELGMLTISTGAFGQAKAVISNLHLVSAPQELDKEYLYRLLLGKGVALNPVTTAITRTLALTTTVRRVAVYTYNVTETRIKTITLTPTVTNIAEELHPTTIFIVLLLLTLILTYAALRFGAKKCR